jgi:hypothetical protein
MKRTLLYTGKRGTLSSSKEKHAFVLRQDLSGRAGSVDFDDANNIVNISYSDTWPGNYDVMHRKLSNFGGAGFTSQRVSWGDG